MVINRKKANKRKNEGEKDQDRDLINKIMNRMAIVLPDLDANPDTIMLSELDGAARLTSFHHRAAAYKFSMRNAINESDESLYFSIELDDSALRR